MAWHRPGDKPLSEPMMVSLLTYIYAYLSLNEIKGQYLSVVYLTPTAPLEYTFDENFLHTDSHLKRSISNDTHFYPNLPMSSRVLIFDKLTWEKGVFRMLELMATAINFANQVKVGNTLDQSHNIKSHELERAHQNKELSWQLLRTLRGCFKWIKSLYLLYNVGQK